MTFDTQGDSRFSPVGSGRKFDCPGCSARVSVRVPSTTKSVVCSSCGVFLDLSDAGDKLVSRGTFKAGVLGTLKIGSKGKFYGTTWEVIGILSKRETNFSFLWVEYILCDPAGNYLEAAFKPPQVSAGA